MSESVANTNHNGIKLKVNDYIYGDFGKYQIEELKGEGTYGTVASCVDKDTNKNVAIKISRLRLSYATKHEAHVLKELRCLSKKNVVRMIKSFKYQDHYCLVLESLDKSLYDFLCERKFKPLHLCEIQYITKQLLVAFEGLAKHGFVHGDVKPDNIMLVNHKSDPFQVKLIDFGFSTRVSCLTPGVTLHTLGYRAPEGLLGNKMTEATDIWAFGCVLAFLYIAQHLFPLHCQYECMRIITQMQGLPDNHHLKEGLFTSKFFSVKKELTDEVWQLHTRDEYTSITGKKSSECKNFSRNYTCLEDMMKNHPKPQTQEEEAESQAFFSLLKQMLDINPEKRISARDALKHSFITSKPTHKALFAQCFRKLIKPSCVNNDGDESSSSSDSSSYELENGRATGVRDGCYFFQKLFRCLTCTSVSEVDD